MPGTEKKKARDRERMRVKRANGGWRLIESSPKTNSARLVWNPHNHCVYCVYWADDEEEWAVFGGYREYIDSPTHWMPLPNPPSSKAQKDRADE